MTILVTCTTCGSAWRERCYECAENIAAVHREVTGHAVSLPRRPEPAQPARVSELRELFPAGKWGW